MLLFATEANTFTELDAMKRFVDCIAIRMMTQIGVPSVRTEPRRLIVGATTVRF